jgi:hypothetical protein
MGISNKKTNSPLVVLGPRVPSKQVGGKISEWEEMRCRRQGEEIAKKLNLRSTLLTLTPAAS